MRKVPAPTAAPMGPAWAPIAAPMMRPSTALWARRPTEASAPPPPPLWGSPGSEPETGAAPAPCCGEPWEPDVAHPPSAMVLAANTATVM